MLAEMTWQLTNDNACVPFDAHVCRRWKQPRVEPAAVPHIMGSAHREASDPPQPVKQTVPSSSCVPAAQSEPEQPADEEAEAQPEQAEADTGPQPEEPEAIADDSPLQQCAHHREHSSAACVRCPDCRMRCKRCRVVKSLSEFKLVFKTAKQPGAPLEPFLKATCKACRTAAGSGPGSRSNTTAMAEASVDALPAQRSSREASGVTAAVQQRDEAAPGGETEQQLEVPEAVRSQPDAVPSTSAAPDADQQDLAVAAGQPTDAAADCTAGSAVHSQGPPRKAPPVPCSPRDSAEQLELLLQDRQHHEAVAPAEEVQHAVAEQAVLDRVAEDATSASDAQPADTEVQSEQSSDAGAAALHGNEAAGGQQKQQQQHRQDEAAGEDVQTPVRSTKALMPQQTLCYFSSRTLVCVSWDGGHIKGIEGTHVKVELLARLHTRLRTVSVCSTFPCTILSDRLTILLVREQAGQQVAGQTKGGGRRLAAVPQQGAAVSDPERVPSGTPGSGQSPLSVRSHAIFHVCRHLLAHRRASCITNVGQPSLWAFATQHGAHSSIGAVQRIKPCIAFIIAPCEESLHHLCVSRWTSSLTSGRGMTSSLCASALALCTAATLCADRWPVAQFCFPPIALVGATTGVCPRLRAPTHTFRYSAAVCLRSQVPAEAREVFPSAQLDLSSGQRMVESVLVLQDPRGQVLVPTISCKPVFVPCLVSSFLPQARQAPRREHAHQSCLLGLETKTLSPVQQSCDSHGVICLCDSIALAMSAAPNYWLCLGRNYVKSS